jgi:hypothetical protein
MTMHGIIWNMQQNVALLLLGVASTLRRVKSKRPRLQRRDAARHVSTVRVFFKAGALLLARRSVDATPSIVVGFRAESPVLMTTGLSALIGIPVPCRDAARRVSTARYNMDATLIVETQCIASLKYENPSNEE